MMPIFFRNEGKNCILQLVAGEKAPAQTSLGAEFHVLDSTLSEGAGEKHLPVVERKGEQITVSVGSMAHPMSEEHSIEWVYLETNQGGQLRKLRHSDEPKAVFALSEGEKALAAYAYCNLHGFWKTLIE